MPDSVPAAMFLGSGSGRSNKTMRVVIVAGVAGSLFGAVAAIAVTRLGSPPPLPVVPERASGSVAPPIRIPSSWDKSFLSRISDVEARLGTLESAAPVASESPPPDDEQDWKAVRKVEVEEQYRRDLEVQEQKLYEHSQEVIDTGWARSQSEVIARTFEAAIDAGHPLRVGRIGCRTSTCVAELVYASPDDALADREVLTRAAVMGCRGLSSALIPPTGPGEYTTTVIYDCR
jgi:hypothetical protein